MSGCVTYREDIGEAMAMDKDAVKLYIEKLQSWGEVVDDDGNTLEYALLLRYLINNPVGPSAMVGTGMTLL